MNERSAGSALREKTIRHTSEGEVGGEGEDAPCIPSERKSNQLDMKPSCASGKSVLSAQTVWYCWPQVQAQEDAD